MGEASKLDDLLARRSLSEEEEAIYRPKPPQLRLRADVPSVEVDGSNGARIVRELEQDQSKSLALRDTQGTISAMVISVERYIELVRADLSLAEDKQTLFPGGRVGPTDATLAEAHVEQVDPDATWLRTE
jgi:hypothetical protein